MENLVTIGGLSLGVAGWWALARSMKTNGRPWWWRHTAGFLLFPFAMLGAGMMLGGLLGVPWQEGETSRSAEIFGGLLFALPVLLILWVSRRAAKRRLATAELPPPSSQPAPPATPAPPKPASRQPAPPNSRTPVRSGNLRFQYEDAEGNLSTREVANWSASGRYIKGFCVDRGELRTFRRDRIACFLEGEHLLNSPSVATATPRRAKSRPLEILFTGFDAEAREELEGEAESEGMKVRKSVTQNLDFLCAGPNAGPSKLAEAKAKGVVVMSETEFLDFLDTGVVPS
ncbi:BRCT domain-containing protein [Billgrantia aerodenitrificans]|uniref:BRCT domain-containing protein n=1 Tax=Billgrantia aerodenitrificans TaxID=2733483 RepID=A0ABS9APM0_9GAMM|nr:BRCT domain-containing protein [Halomonas aerodenitrificans]MCE8023657.1 hypothetical protein [Halomonas aerodenitrificans]